MVDTRKPEPDREPDQPELSEHEIREYARRLRALPVDQVIAEALFALLNAAEVKLGRRDARLLIDVVAVSLGHARDYLPAELVARVDDLLGQLRFAQVAAEGRAGQPGHAHEDNDLDRMPTPPTATPVATTEKQPPSSSGRLWVPGH